MAFFLYEQILIALTGRFQRSSRLAQQLPQSNETKIQIAKKFANRFIDSGISMKHGIMGCVVYKEKNESFTRDVMPSVYENALLMPLLKAENVSPDIINGLGRILLTSQRISGFWNMFQNVTDHLAGIFPDDLDNSCLSLYALCDANLISIEECRGIVVKIFEKLTDSRRSPSGVWGTWLPPRQDQVPSSELAALLGEISDKVRLCIGVILNTLHLLAYLNMETNIKGTSQAIEFVANYFMKHVKNLDILQPELYFYYNHFVIYYFTARYVIATNGQGKALGKELAIVLQKRLDRATEKETPSALNIALLTLCMIKMQLHKEGNDCWTISKEQGTKNWTAIKILMVKLLEMQCSSGSFPEAHFYRWSKNDLSAFGGGEVLSTTFVLHAISCFENESVSENI